MTGLELVKRHAAAGVMDTWDCLKVLEMADDPASYFAANMYGVAISHIAAQAATIARLRGLLEELADALDSGYIANPSVAAERRRMKHLAAIRAELEAK